MLWRFTSLALIGLAGCELGSVAVESTSHEPAPPLTHASIPHIDRSELDANVVKAIDDAVTAVQSDKRNAQAWGHLGMLLLAHDAFRPAASCLHQAAQQEPSNADWYYYEFLALRTWNQEAAIKRLREAINVFPGTAIHPRTVLGEMLIEEEKLAEAEAVLTDVLRDDRDSARAAVALAKLRLLRSEPARALQCIELAESVIGATRQTRQLAAEAHRRLGHPDQAMACTQQSRRAVKKNWTDPLFAPVAALRTGLKTRLKQADALFQKQQVDQSIRLLSQVVADYPHSEQARILLARSYIRQRQLDQAERALQDVLARNADSFEANFRMGVVCQIRKQPRQAIQWFEKSLEIQPGNSVAYKNMGIAQLELGQREAAKISFERAVEANPNYFDGHLALGELCIEDRDLPGALAAFQAAAKLRPNDERTTRILGQLKAMRDQ